MATVYIGNARVNVGASQLLGFGGEAEVYELDRTRVLKLYKQPDNADFEGQPAVQDAVRKRLREHQHKLREFPRNLPSNVIAPLEVATTKSGEVVGYTMRRLSSMQELMRYTDQNFRKSVRNELVRDIFRSLHALVEGVHRANVVIGDFNDLNVMVDGSDVSLIDADSMQFGSYLCALFTERFVDPLVCDPNAHGLKLKKPHNEMSDWYAFTIMLMQNLLFVGPYGGIHRPKDLKKLVKPGMRPLRRLTVFNHEVQYPKPAIPFKVLSDDLLHHFHMVFEKDSRGAFPLKLIEHLRWTSCSNCGLVHLRANCPACQQVAPEIVKEKITVRGKVKATRLFRTRGNILAATSVDGEVRWLYHEDCIFRREDKSVVIEGDLDSHMVYFIQNDATVIAKDGTAAVITPNKEVKSITVDSFKNVPAVNANAAHHYWATGGQLFRNGTLGDELVAEVLTNRTLFWVGETFGAGFYKAENLTVGFVFDAESRGINDQVKLPRITGQLIDADCMFSKDQAWLFTTTQEVGRVVNRCVLISRRGEVLSMAESVRGDGSWLSSIHGAVAIGKNLLVPTDDGIVRVECSGADLSVLKTFPDTEPFVEEASQLLISQKGVYVVGKQEITELQIS